MTNEQLIILKRIYNTLAMVETKGDSTIIMADCVKAFRSLIEELEAEQNG